MEKDKRLEELSDKVRRGTPIDFNEAFEVINYQEKLKASKPKNKVFDFFKRILSK